METTIVVLEGSRVGKSVGVKKAYYWKPMRSLADLGGLPVDLLTVQESKARVTGWLNQPEHSRMIITLNAVMFMTALKNPIFGGIIKAADLITIDGYGIWLALQKKGYRNIQRFSGVELVKASLSSCATQQHSVYFYGGTPEVARKIENVVSTKWTKLLLNGSRDGYDFSLPRDQVIQEIVFYQPDLLLVGLGSPRQELFLAEVLPLLKGTIGIGVGGALEVLTGLKRQAPQCIRDHGWEWCFRMFQDPRKLRLLPELFDFWWQFLK